MSESAEVYQLPDSDEILDLSPIKSVTRDMKQDQRRLALTDYGLWLCLEGKPVMGYNRTLDVVVALSWRCTG